jgi:hypothetical protein
MLTEIYLTISILEKAARIMKQTILLAGVLGTILLAPVYGAPAGIPVGLLGTHYVTFDGNSFQNLIGAFPVGYGGAFQPSIYTDASSAQGSPFISTVWCVDYQLGVDPGSDYTANITALSQITTPDPNVRYGNLPSDSQTWSNTLNPVNSYGFNANSAVYRYTLAAALVSEYQDASNQIDPTNLANSSRNKAIQTAIWYLTYNNEYNPGAAWAPFDPAQYGASDGNVNSPNDYRYWVNWAENNVTSVDMSAWAVISGPANADGTLLAPGSDNGYQTFLVQVDALPEPTFFGLLAIGLMGLTAVAVRRRPKLVPVQKISGK